MTLLPAGAAERPSRKLTPARARLCLLVLLGIAVSGLAFTASIPPAPRDPVRQVGDVNLGMWTIARLRAGERYYDAVGSELRRNHYPTRSVFNWRTPLHYMTVAALSPEWAGTALFVLAAAVVLTGGFAYTRVSGVKSVVAPILLLGAMLPALLVRPGGLALPEIAAGVFIGLSLNLYVLGRGGLAAVTGISAVFLRELAAPYAIVCGVLAIGARRRAESRIWIFGGAAYLVYYAVHATAASAAILPGDIGHAHSWVRFSGAEFVLKTVYTYGWLTLLPPPATAVAAAVGLAGAFSRAIPPQIRWSLLIYYVFFSAVGQPFNYYWGYLTCAVWAHAFVHSAEGLTTLVRAARPEPAAPRLPRDAWS